MREQLESNVADALAALQKAEIALIEFDSAPENNRFDSLGQAEGAIEDKLLHQARKDCEGSYKCGNDSYTQDFYVGDKLYRGELTCEYNRHDKQYYYVEEYEFRTWEITE